MNWNQYRSVILLFVMSTFFVLPTPSIAKTDVVYASYKYVMGDNDTKNDAKRLCFLEAKRRCLEKAGTYVESLTEVRDYQLTRDEIRSYTSAIVKVEVVSEKIAFEGESVVVNTTVKAEIDADHTKRELQKIVRLQMVVDKSGRKLREGFYLPYTLFQVFMQFSKRNFLSCVTTKSLS